VSKSVDPSTVSIRRRSAVLLSSAAALFLALSSSTAHADPDEPSLEELNERIAALEEEYDAELVQYTSAKEEVERATEELEEIEEKLEAARDDVALIAASQYKSSGFDPVIEVMVSRSPDEVLSDVALITQVSHINGERVSHLSELKEEAEQAKEEAEAKLAEAEELVEELEAQRDEVLAKIEEYESEQVPVTTGTGSIPESARGWGFDGATPRMAAIRDEIIRKFGAPYPVGCLRPGDPGEHGSGRACDFMMSAGGAMPSAANRELGWQIAEYAKANADRLGVMYVIWEQKIWDSRNPGAGWKPMADRGSITQNHYDHVHISSW
jgi:septal ring factor EnvC (AmiA/AmiB activator)